MAAPASCRSSRTSTSGCVTDSRRSAASTASYVARRCRSRSAGGAGAPRSTGPRSGTSEAHAASWSRTTARRVSSGSPARAGPERVHERLEEERPLGRVAPAAQHGSAGRRARRRHGVEEPGLADAALPDHHHQLGVTVREHGGPRLPEELELLLAADERHGRRRLRRPGAASGCARPPRARAGARRAGPRWRGRARCRGPRAACWPAGRTPPARPPPGRRRRARASGRAPRARRRGPAPCPRTPPPPPGRCRARGARRPGGGAPPAAARRPRGAPGRPSRRPPRRGARSRPEQLLGGGSRRLGHGVLARRHPAGGLRAQLLRLGQVERPGPARA